MELLLLPPSIVVQRPAMPGLLLPAARVPLAHLLLEDDAAASRAGLAELSPSPWLFAGAPQGCRDWTEPSRNHPLRSGPADKVAGFGRIVSRRDLDRRWPAQVAPLLL